jgi:hypothetical protein
MKRALPALLLLLAACHSPWKHGRESYHDGMRLLQYDPARAKEEFLDAEADLGQVLAEPDLETARRVTATSIRIRALIELDRHDEARELALRPLPGFDPERLYEGDLGGLLLLKARALDPERAYAELVLAERRVNTLQARLHVAREQVYALKAINRPQSKAEAVKICQSHAGKLNFDQLKQELSTP